MEVFIYARVSDKSQCLDRQIVATKEYAINTYKTIVEEDHIYTDKITGTTYSREGLDELLKVLRANDVLIIEELDRLGRDKKMIHATLNTLKAKGVRVNILDIPTTLIDLSMYEDGMAKAMLDMINNVLIEVLGTIAEQERMRSKKRQAEGIAAAKKNNPEKYQGRKAVTVDDLPQEFPKLYKQWKASQINATQFAKLLGVKSRTTLYKYIGIYEETHGAK